jgi:hypothetical protein
VVDLFDSHRQTRIWQRERGGLLFVDVGIHDVAVIADASPPHPSDRSWWTSLALDHARCLKDIEVRFNKGLRFVGYWHTHPEAHPHISGPDIAAFAQNLRSPGIELRRMLAIVVGTAKGQAGIAAHLVGPRSARQLSPA